MYLKKSLTKSFRILRGKLYNMPGFMDIGQQFLEDFFSHENLLNDNLFEESCPVHNSTHYILCLL